jgi:hypothetical protein
LCTITLLNPSRSTPILEYEAKLEMPNKNERKKNERLAKYLYLPSFSVQTPERPPSDFKTVGLNYSKLFCGSNLFILVLKPPQEIILFR